MVLDRGKRGHFSRFFIFFDRKGPLKLILGLEDLFILVCMLHSFVSVKRDSQEQKTSILKRKKALLFMLSLTQYLKIKLSFMFSLDRILKRSLQNLIYRLLGIGSGVNIE